jgi:hypothetical protein
MSTLTEINFEIGKCCRNEEEVLRVLFTMPKWEPGQVNGKKNRTLFSFPIKFSLIDE